MHIHYTRRACTIVKKMNQHSLSARGRIDNGCFDFCTNSKLHSNFERMHPEILCDQNPNLCLLLLLSTYPPIQPIIGFLCAMRVDTIGTERFEKRIPFLSILCAVCRHLLPINRNYNVDDDRVCHAMRIISIFYFKFHVRTTEDHHGALYRHQRTSLIAFELH